MRRDWIYALLLLLPAMVLLLGFTHIPAIETLIDSFFSTPRGRRPSAFIEWDNYKRLFEDEVFIRAFTNNLIYAAVTIPASILISLGMAIFVHGKLSGISFLRMAYFTPTVLPLIAVANIWMFFYTPGFGLIDQIRSLFDLPPQNWIGQTNTALYTMIAVAVWKEAGFFMIFYLAALQTIPKQLREAAKLEGAGRWTFFHRVTLPLIMPTTLFISVNAVINSVRLVDHIFVMTEGGPNNASKLLLYYIYEVAFRYWDTAYASTLTVVILGLLSLLAVGQFFFLDRRVHYK
ncbi:carbohydrate ABC transporter permease [Cohaesibacter celericrescens]|jgi:sn-glycerol 3-phosphate transport system permease protein|uniref:ABC transporter permease n=1 Tax=Cohaesibacter celericrescens TaxID=2067669 RepID=A0A2N5XPI1_9HYPH|nr:sugar ABC transporter permease [Cohaesibacter celericrescens]PLW76441.1 ABC transporter permease [Cohaesibacter celericrescens]